VAALAVVLDVAQPFVACRSERDLPVELAELPSITSRFPGALERPRLFQGAGALFLLASVQAVDDDVALTPTVDAGMASLDHAGGHGALLA
jgi:hypothetical protein